MTGSRRCKAPKAVIQRKPYVGTRKHLILFRKQDLSVWTLNARTLNFTGAATLLDDARRELYWLSAGSWCWLPSMNACYVQGFSTVPVNYELLLAVPPLRAQTWQPRISSICSLKQLSRTDAGTRCLQCPQTGQGYLTDICYGKMARPLHHSA